MAEVIKMNKRRSWRREKVVVVAVISSANLSSWFTPAAVTNRVRSSAGGVEMGGWNCWMTLVIAARHGWHCSGNVSSIKTDIEIRPMVTRFDFWVTKWRGDQPSNPRKLNLQHFNMFPHTSSPNIKYPNVPTTQYTTMEERMLVEMIEFMRVALLFFNSLNIVKIFWWHVKANTNIGRYERKESWGWKRNTSELDVFCTVLEKYENTTNTTKYKIPNNAAHDVYFNESSLRKNESGMINVIESDIQNWREPKIWSPWIFIRSQMATNKNELCHWFDYVPNYCKWKWKI